MYLQVRPTARKTDEVIRLLLLRPKGKRGELVASCASRFGHAVLDLCLYEALPLSSDLRIEAIPLLFFLPPTPEQSNLRAAVVAAALSGRHGAAQQRFAVLGGRATTSSPWSA